MELAFYASSVIALLASLGVVTGTNPVHALLYLIVSLISVALTFFALGAPFAGALQVIVYAGAIMVLFVFVVMMLNLGSDASAQERAWLKPRTWIGPSIMATILLLILLAALLRGEVAQVIGGGDTIEAKEVGGLLFGPWLLIVELAAMLLLAALVTASHLGREAETERGSGGES